ncbi:MAG: glycosyltransferase family 4 protein [Spirochaetes bacterium]|nr:glycosyltransferase family 4 protein [Spirochaetota bacterium]
MVRTNYLCFIGNALPRKCGIATFTSDLHHAVRDELRQHERESIIVAMNDIPEGYAYADEVKFAVDASNPQDFHRLADFINYSNVDIVSVQHEFGIYGGPFGGNILIALRNLKVPVVTTLHTVLEEFEPAQKQVFDELAARSQFLVVMSEKAVGILRDCHHVPAEKIRVIPHGMHDMPFADPDIFKEQINAEDKRIILTFGLLSPGKGIEYVIQAMPEVVAEFPDAVYIVVGATHPHIIRDSGEQYRNSLQRMAYDLGVGKNVIFQNRFLDNDELDIFLGACDIYITPYLNERQITSGTLAYAMGVGKAVISTPYWHAAELLADNRGILVPFRSPKDNAAAILGLFRDDALRNGMRKRAYTYCRGMVWKEVARQYLALFDEASKKALPTEAPDLENTYSKNLLDVRLDHILAMTDSVGLFQHATYTVPNLHDGYCLDDISRGMVVATKHHCIYGKLEALGLIQKYLAFTVYAQNPDGSFRNFMSYQKEWLEERGSEDCQGRAYWGLGYVIAFAPEHYQAVAKGIFDRAFPMFDTLTSPRAVAYAVLGLHYYLHRYGGASDAKRYIEKFAGMLLGWYRGVREDSWRWFEESITYDNGVIPHALLLAYDKLKNDALRDCAVEAMDFLHTALFEAGHYSLVGCNGWYPRSGVKARYDQQSIDAASLVEMNKTAYRVLKDEKYLNRMKLAFDWYLGRNDNGEAVYDFTTGGCHDALGAGEINPNEGAESTLSFLLSSLSMVEIATQPREKNARGIICTMQYLS